MRQFDSIAGFLKGPEWKMPVMSFIDHHCTVFDSKDENELAYMEIYADFREMVESLTERHLKEVGYSPAQLAELCASLATDEVGREVLEQILVPPLLAADDFVAFKKMMVERNMELELESRMELQTLSGRTASDVPTEHADDGFEQQLQVGPPRNSQGAAGHVVLHPDVTSGRVMSDFALEQRDVQRALAASQDTLLEEKMQLAKAASWETAALANSMQDAQQQAAAASQIAYLEETFQALVTILDSPEWLTTVSSFMDAECCIFTGVSADSGEGHLACFERFKQMVNLLLAQGLQHRGVSLQMLAHLCCLASFSKLGQYVLEQLLVVEDFALFEGMMLRCNRRQHALARLDLSGTSQPIIVDAAGDTSFGSLLEDTPNGGAGVGIGQVGLSALVRSPATPPSSPTSSRLD